MYKYTAHVTAKCASAGVQSGLHTHPAVSQFCQRCLESFGTRNELEMPQLAELLCV